MQFLKHPLLAYPLSTAVFHRSLLALFSLMCQFHFQFHLNVRIKAFDIAVNEIFQWRLFKAIKLIRHIKLMNALASY